jgi:hypothetical protein
MKNQPERGGRHRPYRRLPELAQHHPGKVVFTIDFRTPSSRHAERHGRRIRWPGAEALRGDRRELRGRDRRPVRPAGLRRGCVKASATPPNGSAIRTWTSSRAPATTPAGSTASRRRRWSCAPASTGLSHNEAEEITKEWAAACDVLMHAVVETAMWSDHQGMNKNERHRRHRRSDLQGGCPRGERQDHRDRAEPEGRRGAGRHRLLRHARRDRPACASGNALHGHLFLRRFRKRHARGALRRHHHGRRFLPAQPRRGAAGRAPAWDNKSTRANCDYSFHMAITWWGEQVFNEMETVVIEDRGINTFKHFMAYKGALMVNDDEMFASFQRCRSWAASPWSMPRTAMSWPRCSPKLLAEGNTGPEAHAYSRPPRWRARPPTAPS